MTRNMPSTPLVLHAVSARSLPFYTDLLFKNCVQRFFFLQETKNFLVAVIKTFQLTSFGEPLKPSLVKMKRPLNIFRHEVALAFTSSCLGGF